MMMRVTLKNKDGMEVEREERETKRNRERERERKREGRGVGGAICRFPFLNFRSQNIL